ncbi:FEKKY domain-containing protein [Chryseobacterium sp. A301]
MKIIYVLVVLAYLMTIREVDNPNNYTLTGAGWSGMYSDFNDLSQEREALSIVAGKWNIKLESIGCSITKENQWKLIKNNFEAEKNLKKKFGYNWLEEFKKEVHAEHSRMRLSKNN